VCEEAANDMFKLSQKHESTFGRVWQGRPGLTHPLISGTGTAEREPERERGSR
jgi:hypothetical protein